MIALVEAPPETAERGRWGFILGPTTKRRIRVAANELVAPVGPELAEMLGATFPVRSYSGEEMYPTRERARYLVRTADGSLVPLDSDGQLYRPVPPQLFAPGWDRLPRVERLVEAEAFQLGAKVLVPYWALVARPMHDRDGLHFGPQVNQRTNQPEDGRRWVWLVADVVADETTARFGDLTVPASTRVAKLLDGSAFLFGKKKRASLRIRPTGHIVDIDGELDLEPRFGRPERAGAIDGEVGTPVAVEVEPDTWELAKL